MKILLAAPQGRATDALCGLLKKLDPAYAIEIISSALSSACDASPDLFLLDVDTVTDAAKQVAAAAHAFPRSSLVAMGTNLDNAFVEAIMEAGALGYLPKNLSETVTLGMLRMILGGADGAAQKSPFQKTPSPQTLADEDAVEPWQEFGLTPRQIDVLALATEGKTNQSIAKQLGITEGVVKLHMTAVFKALKVHNRSEAVLLAARLKSVNFRHIREAEGGRLDLDWLLEHMTHQHMLPDSVLFRQGDPGRELFYLQRGTIRLPEIGTELTRGSMFGEIGIFAPDHKRTTSAVCATEVDVFRLTADQVKRLYLLNPQFALFIVHLIAKRLMADQARSV
jgi:two-component system nitrate/nitrite response regulator NarL